MKIKIIRSVLLVLLLGIFGIIFGFSNQDADKSGKVSNRVAEIIVKQLQLDKIENKQPIQERTQKIIRKVAHFSIYTLVGLLAMAYISTYNLKESQRVIISLCIGIVYAMSDEIHQLFIPGRAGQLTDVILDTMGVILGILLILVMLEIDKKIKNRKNLV